jgi:hypothetical protein
MQLTYYDVSKLDTTMLTELIIFFYCCFFRLDVQHQTPNYIAFWSILQVFSVSKLQLFMVCYVFFYVDDLHYYGTVNLKLNSSVILISRLSLLMVYLCYVL